MAAAIPAFTLMSFFAIRYAKYILSELKSRLTSEAASHGVKIKMRAAIRWKPGGQG